MKVELQPCYILHSRPYRDTSLIVDVLSRDYGRLGVLARGYRQKRGGTKASLSPFTPWLMSWQGRGELKSLSAVESGGTLSTLAGNHLYSGLYLNELLMRLIPAHDAHPEIFQLYDDNCRALSENALLEPLLRNFEFLLLEYLGYGISFDAAAHTGLPIAPEQWYRYFPESGFVMIGEAQRDDESFFGEDLLAIAQRQLDKLSVLRSAKRLSRLALAPHLGNKPLRSREVFRKRPT